MSDDLVKRLRFHRHDLCVEAAAALEAKDAEIAGLRKQIVRMGTGADKKNAQIIAAVAEIAALKARIAAAEGVAAADYEHRKVAVFSSGKQFGKAILALDAARAAYDALRAAQGEKQG